MYHNKMDHHNVSLTKENFWNDLYSKYPKGVQAFCDWVDLYKKAVGWNELFNPRFLLKLDRSNFKERHAPKFHDLPIAMQEGIWWAFVRDRGGCYYPIDVFSDDLSKHITHMVKMLQDEAEV